RTGARISGNVARAGAIRPWMPAREPGRGVSPGRRKRREWIPRDGVAKRSSALATPGSPPLEGRSVIAESEGPPAMADRDRVAPRSEEHTSELQSRVDLVCRLLLEKNKSRIR